MTAPELGESSHRYWPVAGAGSQTLHPLRILGVQQISTGSSTPVQPPRASTHPSVPCHPGPIHTTRGPSAGRHGQPSGSRHAPSRDFKAGSIVCVSVCPPPLSTAALIDVTSPRDNAEGPDPAIVPGLEGDVRLLGGGSSRSQACFHLPDLPRWREGSSQGTGLGRGVPTAQQKGHE